MTLRRLLLLVTLFVIGHSCKTMAQEDGHSPNKIQQENARRKNKAILKRKDSFFGLHFDFHALPDDEHIGRTLTYGMIDSLLKAVHPDFIQVDCKGHPGISSYPTKVGTPAKSFDKDPLKLWRELTRKYGVALYVHYSGVYEKQAVRLHPEWAALNAAGKMDSDKISVHSGYVDELLIPQLKELSRDYGVDGVWVDGDCWAVVPDYSPAALKAFRAETGMTSIPRSSKDSGYARFLDFNRQSFLNYVQRYASAMHAFNPGFQVASNWAFSSFMPQPVTVDVDFLSGDLTPVNSLNNAAFEGRCLASQGKAYGKPWDIMSWGFTLNWDRQGLQTKKSAIQLEQEAAEIISMGGGFQCYFTQNRDASIKPWEIPTMKGLGDFVQACRAFCKGAIPVPQVAILYSGATHERETRNIFTNGGLERIKGITTALLDGQEAVEIKMEHHLHGNMQQYPLIVIPEWDWLADSLRNELLSYVSHGGRLLVIGTEATRLFEKEAGIRLEGQATANKIQYLGYDKDMAAIQGDYQPVELLTGTRSFGMLYDQQDLRFNARAAASIADYGKGQIACVFANMGENYQNNTSSLERDFLNGLLRELFARPMVSVSGSHLVHLAVNRLGTKCVIHLINTAGQHANKNFYSYDEIPAVGPLTLRIRMNKPNRLMLQPENRPLPFSYEKGEVMVKLPQLR
ncbi:MAG: alpha-L-fucosidase, partial [Bacteroidota bacterium]|nr:alpha-L-fucosidase [Bacteroidota bacterium]